jgi:hypothetical protein
MVTHRIQTITNITDFLRNMGDFQHFGTQDSTVNTDHRENNKQNRLAEAISIVIFFEQEHVPDFGRETEYSD